MAEEYEQQRREYIKSYLRRTKLVLAGVFLGSLAFLADAAYYVHNEIHRERPKTEQPITISQQFKGHYVGYSGMVLMLGSGVYAYRTDPVVIAVREMSKKKKNPK